MKEFSKGRKGCVFLFPAKRVRVNPNEEHLVFDGQVDGVGSDERSHHLRPTLYGPLLVEIARSLMELNELSNEVA